MVNFENVQKKFRMFKVTKKWSNNQNFQKVPKNCEMSRFFLKIYQQKNMGENGKKLREIEKRRKIKTKWV